MNTLPRALRVALLVVAGYASALAQTPPPEKPTEKPPEQPKDAPPAPTAPPARGGGGAPPSDDAFKMGSPPALAEGTTEEQMWPAATAEGWRKPCLVPWQRTFDDALRVARAEHRPILVAVNMDGEIASEHFAGVRYREAETAAQMAPYVTIVASVYRHTPRDYDETGKRVTCPRFGTVTCGEHIENERELYSKYFDGKRVSPRHIVLDTDGKETYDVYFSWDTATVFTTFVKGAEGWPPPAPNPERSLAELAKSADVEDRIALERAYVEGDRATRQLLLETLRTQRVVDQVEVLRAGTFGLDLELARLARHALAQCETEGALDLMAEVLKSPLEASERQLLLEAVARLSKKSPRARTLAAMHGGLSLTSRLIGPAALESGPEAGASPPATRPADADGLLAFADAMLALEETSADRRHTRARFEDARAAVRDAEKLGARGPRIDALAAASAEGLGDLETARTRATAAVEGGLLRDAAPDGGALSRIVRARVARLFGDARQRAIRAAYRAGTAWPPEWLSDVSAAYTSLSGDLLVEPTPLLEYHDFLRWIGATTRANAVLDDALARFPDSAVLHERLRGQLLWDGGPAGLERGYAERLAKEGTASDGTTRLDWYSGYASLVAAEHYRRRNEFETATAAYGRALERLERDAERFPAARDTTEHYIALARAGRARVALERGDLASATADLLEGVRVRPDASGTPDGLSLTPVMTALMLKARLLEAGDEERAGQVQAALDGLDPALLVLPSSTPPDRGGQGASPERPRNDGRYRPPPRRDPR